MAATSGAWLRRKVSHPWPGGPRRLTMYLATLDCATSNPSLSSSPWMRGAPQRDAMGRRRGVWHHRCCMYPPMERPMKRNDLSRSLVAFDQASTMVAVVELSFRSWLVAGLVPHPPAAEEAGSRCASVIDATAPLAAGSHQGRQHNQPHCRSIRGWPRRLLACALVAGARD